MIDLTADDVGSIEGLRDGQGVLYVPHYDAYTFSLAPDAHLELDGRAVEAGMPVQLAEGNHRIAVDPPGTPLAWSYTDQPDPKPIPAYYLFHDPVTPNGLLATFYANGDWEGAPAAQRIYPLVYQYIHVVPINRPYSVRYSGYLYVPQTGDYQFGLQVIDTGALDLDGKNVIQTTTPDQRTTAPVTLERGWHRIEVRHQDLTEGTRIYLTWAAPGSSDFEPVMHEYLCPAADLCDPPAAH